MALNSRLLLLEVLEEHGPLLPRTALEAQMRLNDERNGRRLNALGERMELVDRQAHAKVRHGNVVHVYRMLVTAQPKKGQRRTDGIVIVAPAVLGTDGVDDQLMPEHVVVLHTTP